MGIEPPFLYDHPSRYTFAHPTDKSFNPKAVSQASFALPVERPKHEGPLINSKEFNRHPDSYFVVPYGNLNYKPMSPRTKQKVKYVRLIQLFLRVCALLGAMGMLFCVICINKTESTVSWVLKIAPIVAILHTVYAVYHLCRSAKSRTPASSASYMIFAAIIDSCLVPFFVVTALMARTEHNEPSNTAGHWQTLFGTDVTNYKIFYATFLLSVIDGGLHIISLAISIYLTVIFRKICRLPPDANPLEDNLTSRAHKRNKSSIVDNRTSQATTATANSKRDSGVAELLISPTRNVPFMHTRTESNTDLNNTPRPYFSPRDSRTNISAPFYDQPLSQRTSRVNTSQSPNRPHSFYEQPYSNRTSRNDVRQSPERPRTFYEQRSSNHSTRDDIRHSPNRPHTFYEQPSSSRSTRSDLHQSPNRPQTFDSPPPPENLSRAEIPRAPTMSPSVYTNFSRPPSTRPPSTRPHSVAPTTVTTTTADDNWITHPSPPSSPPAELQHLRTHNKKSYTPVLQSAPSLAWNNENFNPLELNPPTPPNPERRPIAQQRPLTQGTGNSLGFGVGKLRDYEGMRKGFAGQRVVSSGRDDGGRVMGGGVRMRGVSGKIVEEGKGGEWFARSER